MYINDTGASAGAVPTNRYQPTMFLRFLRMTSDHLALNYTITFADPPDSSRFVLAKVAVKSLNDEIMDVAFVEAVGERNYHGGLPSMMEDYRFDHAVALGEHWAYIYLIDLDGQSYSGRFMGFMASDSAVMKGTVYREYYSDWIQPWYESSLIYAL
jgi:hypothetical protein